MTSGKRIALNVIATYGRSLYALVLGLVSGRWILMALGESDYGIVGLVGGLVAFVSVFNAILASAVGRFLAVGIGAAKKDGNAEKGVEECRRWFSVSIMIHTLLPILLVAIGYPLGEWAIDNILILPADRIETARLMWCLSCISCFVGMVTVPFNALYIAKQEIAELTIYGGIATTLNAVVLYYMVTHPQFWLVKYSVWAAFISVLPHIAIMISAFFRFKECRIGFRYFFDRNRIVQLVKYAFARFWSDFSDMIAIQGRALLVNRYMGVDYNASMTVANQVAGHAMTLSNSLSGAFWPAIANKCGEGRYDEVVRLHYMICRMGAVLVLVFAVPLALEVEEVLRIWLVTPPLFAGSLVFAILFRMAFLRMTDGYWMAILGSGRGVMRYSWTVGWAEIGLVAIVWIGFVCGFSMWSVVAGYMFSAFFCVAVRLWYGRTLLGFSIIQWIRRVLAPIGAIVAVTLVSGCLIRCFMAASFLRIVFSTVVCESVLIPLTWLFVLNGDERAYVLNRLEKIRSVVINRKEDLR